MTTIKEVARRMCKSEQYIRIGLQTGRLPFGTAVKVSPGRWSYHVPERAFKDYMGE